MDQVMACCLTAPSHYLNQCWLIISEVMWLHLRAFPREMFKISILDMSLKMTNLRFHSNLPGVSELTVPMGLRGGARVWKLTRCWTPGFTPHSCQQWGCNECRGQTGRKRKRSPVTRDWSLQFMGDPLWASLLGNPLSFVSTLRLRRNGYHFADGISKCIFLNGNCILLQFSLSLFVTI